MSDADRAAQPPRSERADTNPAGEDVSDEEMTEQVAQQTSSDLKVEDVFEREGQGTRTERAAAESQASDLR